MAKTALTNETPINPVLYTDDKLDGCLELFLDVFWHEPFNFDRLERSDIRRYLDDMAHTPGFLGLVYMDEGVVAAFVFGFVNDYFTSGFYEVRELAVSRRYQGKGLGGRFMTACEPVLVKRGVSSITVATNRDIPAYGFYLKNGYLENENTVYLSKRIEL